jgi:hypothetical protein
VEDSDEMLLVPTYQENEQPFAISQWTHSRIDGIA